MRFQSKAVLVDLLTKEKCFICGEPCELYVHRECARVYDDYKSKMLKQMEKDKYGGE